MHDTNCGMRISELALCAARHIALGKQCQAMNTHVTGAPHQDTRLAYSSDTALFNLGSLNGAKGGAESFPTELAARHSLLIAA